MRLARGYREFVVEAQPVRRATCGALLTVIARTPDEARRRAESRLRGRGCVQEHPGRVWTLAFVNGGRLKPWRVKLG